MDNLTLSFAGFTCDWKDLPDNSKAALAALGFSTKIKNSVAGLKKAIMGEGANPWSDDDIAAEAARLGLSEFGRDEATANAIIAATQKEMFESILSGVNPARQGRAPRLSDDDKLRHTIAVEFMTAAAKRQNKVLPKRSKPDEKAAFDALLAKALERPDFAKAVEAEFASRKKKATKEVAGLEDLFA